MRRFIDVYWVSLSALADSGVNPAMSPCQSYAVSNTAIFLFDAACEHDKNIQKHEIFKRKFRTWLPKRFQLQWGFAPDPFPGPR